MSNSEKKILCGDDLLNCDPNDYKNVPLAMSQQSNTIGIATDDNGAYYVYQKGERNAVDWKKPFDSFDSALEYAKSTYKDFLDYLEYLYGDKTIKNQTSIDSYNAQNDSISSTYNACEDKLTSWDDYGRAKELYRMSEYEAAIAYYRKAIEINPNFAEAYNDLGMIYRELKQYEAAIACYRIAIEINPHFAEAYNNLGMLYRALKWHEGNNLLL